MNQPAMYCEMLKNKESAVSDKQKHGRQNEKKKERRRIAFLAEERKKSNDSTGDIENQL